MGLAFGECNVWKESLGSLLISPWGGEQGYWLDHPSAVKGGRPHVLIENAFGCKLQKVWPEVFWAGIAVLAHTGHAQLCHQGCRFFIFVMPYVCWFSWEGESLGDLAFFPCSLHILLVFHWSELGHLPEWPKGMRVLWLVSINQESSSRDGVRNYFVNDMGSLATIYGNWRKGDAKDIVQAMDSILLTSRESVEIFDDY